MAHMMKHTKASCGHMFAHFDRKAANICNENLDRTRTHLNYNLATHQTMDQGEFVKQRCSEVRCQNRKDVNVMVSWVVTAPKDLPETEHKSFFQASYDFLSNRYGKENVISAYVHMDEVTPHMHFAFVPVHQEFRAFDGFVGIYEQPRLSAKKVVDRNDLRTFHTDLQKYVERELGHEVGILNEATKEGNKSIAELKRKSATERLQEVEKAEHVAKARVAMSNLEFDAKQTYMDAFNEKSRQVSQEDVKVSKKGLIRRQNYVTVPEDTWNAVRMSRQEQDMIERAKNSIVANVREFKKTVSYENLVALSQRVNELTRQNENIVREHNALVQQNEVLSEQLRSAELKSDKIMKKVNDVLRRLPEDVARSFRDEWNGRKEPEREPERETPARHWDDYGMDR